MLISVLSYIKRGEPIRDRESRRGRSERIKGRIPVENGNLML